jgi:hypothetical protein
MFMSVELEHIDQMLISCDTDESPWLIQRCTANPFTKIRCVVYSNSCNTLHHHPGTTVADELEAVEDPGR